LYTTGKGKFMDKVERFYIYRETQDNNQNNDKNTVKQNAIFDAINSHGSTGACTN
jgi:endo-alpha-1,4-polygalactosaminidase (GH114 family)